MAELKSQIYELKKNQIDADSIYGFLGAFNEVYSECTDAEKKQFMQAFIERIDIFPERREDGNSTIFGGCRQWNRCQGRIR